MAWSRANWVSLSPWSVTQLWILNSITLAIFAGFVSEFYVVQLYTSLDTLLGTKPNSVSLPPANTTSLDTVVRVKSSFFVLPPLNIIDL